MPDVRILAPPVAKISYSKKQEFSEEYFHILVSGVILRSLGRIETGLDSNLKGSLGTPPLKQELLFFSTFCGIVDFRKKLIEEALSNRFT